MNPELARILARSEAFEAHYRRRAVEYAAYHVESVRAFAPRILAMAESEAAHREGLWRMLRWHEWLELCARKALGWWPEYLGVLPRAVTPEALAERLAEEEQRKEIER